MMANLKAYGSNISSIFQLIGDKENDITKSIAWALAKCPVFLRRFVKELINEDIETDSVNIFYQKYDFDTGITDIEMTDNNLFYIIIEAKKGWLLPGADQLTKYSLREDFKESTAKNKMIVSMSECTNAYAESNLPFLVTPNGISVKHLSWQRIYEITSEARYKSNNEQKHLLEELKEYFRGIMTSQTKDSNWVYVVALGKGTPDNCELTWTDIVKKKNKYFCPMGGTGGWPKNPPNYIAFRYDGQLQTIHHIESYVVSRNLHEQISEMPNKEETIDHFVYSLGPAIIPAQIVKTGKIYRNGRVWAMLDTLLTSETISIARDISYER